MSDKIETDAGTQEPSAVASSELLGVGIEHADGAVVCALCGYEAEWSECCACGGKGGFDGYEEDPLWYLPGELAPCPQCNSAGGDWLCENPKCENQNLWKLRKAKPTPNVES